LKRKLPPFDRYKYYRQAVQSPDVDCEFITWVYKKLRRKRPFVLREDFCGAFAICCEWVKKGRDRRAIGVDLDPEPLEYGRNHYLPKLSAALQPRVELVRGSVLTAKTISSDVTIAFNFSYYIFKSRLLLRQYFTRARKGLGKNGLFIVDCFGGSACQEPNVEQHKIGKFTYYWDQQSFDPVTHDAQFYIHFKRQGEPKRERVFGYDWRMWTIPEIREVMMEAGFLKTRVFWEGTTRSGGGNGIFTETETGDSSESWIAYVIGEVD